MVIDTSAWIAILQQEPEAEAYAEAIENDPVRLLSAVSALETAIVIETRKGSAGGRALDLMLIALTLKSCHSRPSSSKSRAMHTANLERAAIQPR